MATTLRRSLHADASCVRLLCLLSLQTAAAGCAPSAEGLPSARVGLALKLKPGFALV